MTSAEDEAQPWPGGRREQVAAALWRIVARDGPDRASMRAIAREAGCTTGVLTHYFADKGELTDFAATWLIDRVIARVAGATRGGDLTAGCAELLPLDDERREEARLWVTVLGWSADHAELARQLARGHQALRLHLGETVARARPQLTAAQAHHVGDQLLAVVDGLTLAALANPTEYPPDTQLELLRSAVDALA